MSNNLVSEPLPIPIWQMEPVSKQDSSLLNMQIGVTGPMSANSVSRSAASNQQKVPSDGGTGPMWNNAGLQKPLLPTKRKAATEPLPTSSLPQQSSVVDKRVAQVEPNVNSPRSSQLSAVNRRQTQLQSMPSKSGSQRLQTPKSRTAAQEVSPKVQNGSFEAVRSKMRETLAAALSVGSQNHEKAPNEDNASPFKAGSAQGQAHVNSQPAGSTAPPVEANAPPGSSVDILKETAAANKLEDCGSTAGESAASENIQNARQTGTNDGQEPQYNYVMPDADGSFGDTFFVKDELLQGNGLSWAWDMEVAELKEVQIDEKSNSVHMDVGRNGAGQGESGDIPKLERDANANGTEQIVRSPQELAFKIEAELFKLFGGVNKKYKEKGRSLMFNLKDRNNPELREKVLSGVISPERLCSMTPEELASKELSEWRMAKAEELDKMIVLPDSDVDIRRLVKKTHKGEYQVEVEQDDAVSVEVSVGSSSFTQLRPKKKKTGHPSSEAYEVKEKEIAEGDKSSSENRDPASSLTIPADGTDFMQELIVDEFKDEGFLPPIVSLDEFMESLNSEPPFENLPVDSKETKPLADKGSSESGGRTGSEKASSEPASANPPGAEAGTTNQLKVKTPEPLLSVKTHETSVERKTSPAASAVMGEHVWEGELQLTISSSVPVIGLFRSGEKTSTKEWPGSMEIKGRVRLDAFEKFIQELPMSRSRAVMVVHFVLKDPSSEIHHAILSEAVDSYVGDERLGFGEPNPGVELYFCPPRTRMIEMLSRHLVKDRTDVLKSNDNGLIGVVVWRRPHFSSINSPNSSSHHKHHRMHNFPTRRQENINANMNSNLTGNVNRRLPPQPNNDDDNDDDIPPGFGPGAAAARDEDDLPEFNFSGNSNPSGQKVPAQVGLGSRVSQSNPSRPVDQMRQLIYRYGQTASGVDRTNWNGNRGAGTDPRPWNQDDDDDDMPEWQPQLPQKHHQPELPGHNIQQPLRPHMVNQIRPPIGQVVRPQMTMQPPHNVLQNVARWVPPSPGPHGLPPNAAVPGQNYGGQWRQDAPAPRSRGF